MASLKKIAADLGVSYTLVSKVLSGRLGTTGVSEKTREAILRKSKDWNYEPNRLAVALQAGRKGAVGIFFHQLGTPGSEVSERLLKGLAEGLEKSNYRMMLRFFKTQHDFLDACDIRIRAEVDGLIVAGVSHPELIPKFREMEAQNVKVVSMFGDYVCPESIHSTNVTVDYEMQGYLPTKHFLDRGFRHIACMDTIKSRTQGFRRAFREAQVPFEATLFETCEGFSPEDGEAAARRLLAARVPLEAVVCQSDAQAVGAINFFIRQGIRVPEDIRVTGVDNSAPALYCIVPLTSVTSEMGRSGQKAVELLLKKIDGTPALSTTIPPSLKIRESSR
jgi:DNA-binding LacI/PurR family transcriptional regulator